MIRLITPRREACILQRVRDRGVRARAYLRRFEHAAPVEHICDARSLLLLKLLFLDRGDLGPGPLLRAQRLMFKSLADRLVAAVAEARGFEQTILTWRLESATAAVRFIDATMNHTR